MSRPEDGARRTKSMTVGALVTLFVAAAILVWVQFASPAAEPMRWTRYSDARDRAWLYDRMIFYYFTAKSGCPECRRVDAMLDDDAYARAFRFAFVTVRVVDHRPAANPDWVTDLERQYKVTTLPAVVVVNGINKIQFRSEGPQTPARLRTLWDMIHANRTAH